MQLGTVLGDRLMKLWVPGGFVVCDTWTDNKTNACQYC